MAIQISVFNGGHSGYRRGGVALATGKNIFDQSRFTSDQLARLQADKRLVVTIGEAAAADQSDGAQGQLGPVVLGVDLAAAGADQTVQLGVATGGTIQGTVEQGAVTDTLEKAFNLLVPGNPEHFTKSELPQLAALSLMLGRDVSAKERDDAWKLYKAASSEGAV